MKHYVSAHVDETFQTNSC